MYIPALFKGSRCTEEELDALAEKYSGYTGLKKEYVLGSSLRVTLDDFMTELLKDKKLMIGRYDGRITGPAGIASIEGGYLSQEKIINECISKNPFLKVWVLCGYYDAATPFYAAEYTFDHVFLNDDLRDNVSFTYYHSGHMIYMEKESFDKFRKDAEAWF